MSSIMDKTVDLDLTVVRDRLASRAMSGREAICPPIPLDQLDGAIENYKRFLWMLAKYPGARIVPSPYISEVWTQHIEFTEKYRHECLDVFGGFLDHRPYFTRNDVAMETTDLRLTRELWWNHYGDDGVPADYDGLEPPLSGWGGAVVSL